MALGWSVRRFEEGGGHWNLFMIIAEDTGGLFDVCMRHMRNGSISLLEITHLTVSIRFQKPW